MVQANELLHFYWRDLNGISRTKLDEFGIVTGGAFLTIGATAIFGPAAFFVAPVYAVAAKVYEARHKRDQEEIFEVIAQVQERVTEIQKRLVLGK